MTKIEDIYEIYKSHSQICTDTRVILKDSLFFALKGENFDANTFAEDALAKGAAYCIVDDPKLPDKDRFIKVENVLNSLQSLARYHRSKLDIPFIGLTGSNGKTTTKELLHAVLSEKYKVLSTNGNFNNHIGVPLTILRISKEHELAIIEMGANHIGEIEFLSEIAQPDIGVITNIGKAHLKGFGSFKGVIEAKTELYKHIAAKKGIVFVLADDHLLMSESSNIERKLYGLNTNCSASYSLDNRGRVRLAMMEDSKEIQTNLFGEYNFHNLLCAICIARYFEVSDDLIRKALSSYIPTNNRSQIIETSDNFIIMDAYNANPSSMQLAIKSFERLDAAKKVVILGDMLELGDEEVEEHKKILNQLELMNLESVFLVGKIFSSIKSSSTFCSVEKVEELMNVFEAKDFKNHHFLIKGSRGIKLEKILERIG